MFICVDMFRFYHCGMAPLGYNFFQSITNCYLFSIEFGVVTGKVITTLCKCLQVTTSQQFLATKATHFIFFLCLCSLHAPITVTGNRSGLDLIMQLCSLVRGSIVLEI